MLETVKDCITSLTDMTFIAFFNQYRMKVQDQNLDKEIAHLLNRNFISVNQVDKILLYTMKGLVQTQ